VKEEFRAGVFVVIDDTQTEEAPGTPEKKFYFSHPTAWVMIAAPFILGGALVAIGSMAHAVWGVSPRGSVLLALAASPLIAGLVLTGTTFALIKITNRYLERPERDAGALDQVRHRRDGEAVRNR